MKFYKFVSYINIKTLKMKKLLLSTVLVVALGLSFTSCRETEKKADDMGDAIENAADDTADAMEDAADDAADKTEGALEKAGKAIDNATNEVKEAGKAVDGAAKEIVGDDN